MSCEIPLTRGMVALVDDEDFEMLSGWKWSAHTDRRARYAVRGSRTGGVCRPTRMHRQILLPDPGVEVDHINGDGLDNRRANLRCCTHRENQANLRPQRGRTSAFQGVSWSKGSGKWVAHIGHDGRARHLGCFDNEIDAALAYDLAALRFRGEFARPNFLRAS